MQKVPLSKEVGHCPAPTSTEGALMIRLSLHTDESRARRAPRRLLSAVRSGFPDLLRAKCEQGRTWALAGEAQCVWHCGFPDNELRFKSPWMKVLAIYAGQHHLQGLFSHFTHGRPNRGQGYGQGFGDRDIVETDDGDIFAGCEPFFSKGTECADCGKVIYDKERRRGRTELQQFACRLVTRFHIET